MNDATQHDDARSRGQAAMAALNARLYQIRQIQVWFTVKVLVGTAIWYFCLLLYFRDVQRTNFVFSSTFQYLAVSYACWFMVPYFLRVEAKQDVGLAMGHDSVDILAKVDQAIDERARRMDKLMDSAEALIGELKAGKGALIERVERAFRDELEKLRAEIREGREGADAEVAEALDEGEAAAGTEGEESCAFCGQAHVGPCPGPTGLLRACSVCGGFHDGFKCPKCDLCARGEGPHLHRPL